MFEACVQSGTIDGQMTQGSPFAGSGCGMYCCHVSSCELLLVYKCSPTLSAPMEAMLGADTKIAASHPVLAFSSAPSVMPPDVDPQTPLSSIRFQRTKSEEMAWPLFRSSDPK